MPENSEGDKSKAPRRSRLQKLKDDNKDDQYQPAMPDLECGSHLLDYLWSWGPTLSGSMGEAPLNHSELVACQHNTGIELSEWEASTLIRMSKAYLGESHQAIKRDCPPPFGDDGYLKRVYVEDAARNLDDFLS
ncbi:hypothetical protein F2P44_03985 [Massilia sp. CCM 8695]|uniref:Uncharacterized protein n=1 Tax=Massilia frigida TaxID=2609281 RepID=A0ABX0N074_9BURK|nr:hypothetical protein [Massilia frigida]NHZ78447.1 hypothetical protein [Massilia frigida]